MLTDPNSRADAARPSRFSSFMGLEAGEGRPVISVTGLNFAVSTAFVLVQTSAFGLFIETFGSHTLPYAYFSVAILSSLIAYIFLQVSQRVSFALSLYINLAFLAGASLLFWLGLRSAHARWFVFLLPFWFQTLVNLANLVVWHLASHMFHVRQAKRVFGLIVGGNWIANIVGGVLVASFLGDSSPANLYLLAAIALALSMLVLRAGLRILRSHAAAPVGPSTPQASGRAAARVAIRHPYSRLIFAYTLLWWLAFFVLENIFYHQVEGELKSSGALVSFLGWQLAVMGVIALFTTSIVTSRVARRYGLRLGLLVMPAVVTVAILLLALGGSLGWSTSFLFWTATIARTLNIAIGFSLSQAMGSLLFQPLQGSLRAAAQTISEGIVQPVAIGLAGVVLLVFNTTAHLGAVGLAYVFLVVAVPWFWTIFALARSYPLVMSEALRKRALGESSTVLFDTSAVNLLRHALHQPQPSQALYALNQLRQIAPDSWPWILEEELPRLLQHPAAEVRLEALQGALALPLANSAPLLRDQLERESEPRVTAMLLRVLAAIQDPASVNRIVASLESPERVVQAGAILGLLDRPGTDAANRARVALEGLVASPIEADRLAACDILAELTGTPGGVDLVRLIADGELTVRQAALRAARRHFEPGVIMPVLEACDDPACARLAESALVEFAARDAPAVLRAATVALEAGPSSRRALSIIRVLGRIADRGSLGLLVPAIDSADPRFRQQALLSLSRLGYRAPSAEPILNRVRSEVMNAAWLAAALQCEDAIMGWPVLQHALETEFSESRGRILLLLSFIFDARAVLVAGSALDRPASTQKAMALETIDALLPVTAKPLILPILEDVPQTGRLTRLRAAGISAPDLSSADVLRALMPVTGAAHHATWTRMCALYVIGHARLAAFRQTLQEQAGADPGLESMRRWSLGQLLSAAELKGDENMLSLVEKVLILKSAPLFAETSDHVLAEIAGLVEQVPFEKDQAVFHQGDPGDSLYVIVSGSVRVWDGDRLLNELKEGDAFGELALLDPEPRLGTVKAAETTQLLRLDSASFREVLESQPEVSSAILRVVTKYLRSQLQFAREASARIRTLESLTPMPPVGVQ